jgi:MFS family permease
MAMPLRRTFRALRSRNYRLFFFGQGVSLIGTWLQQVAMGWLVYRLTGSAWLLGVVAFCSNIGILVFGNVAGVLADRVDRERGLVVTQSLMLLQAIVLAALTATGAIATWHLIVLALWLGTCTAFDLPMRQSMYVHFVESRADLPNAIALNSLLVNCARVVGPALAGMLLSVTSEAVCFALNALSFVAVIVALLLIRWPAHVVAKASPGWWSSWLEGARYTTSMPAVRALLVLVAALAWTITPYTSLMPVFAKDIYGGGPHTLGWLLSAAGAGALLSTGYLASRPTVRGLAGVIARAAGVAGLGLAAFASVRVYPLALVFLFVSGGALILAAAGSNTILQTIVEDRLRGRVAAFYTLSFLGIAPLGNLAAGALAGAIGAPLTFVANGALALLAAAWFWRQLPVMRASLRPIYRNLGILDEPTAQARPK